MKDSFDRFRIERRLGAPLPIISFDEWKMVIKDPDHLLHKDFKKFEQELLELIKEENITLNSAHHFMTQQGSYIVMARDVVRAYKNPNPNLITRWIQRVTDVIIDNLIWLVFFTVCSSIGSFISNYILKHLLQ